MHRLSGRWAAEGLHQAVPRHRPGEQAQGQRSSLPPGSVWGADQFFLKIVKLLFSRCILLNYWQLTHSLKTQVGSTEARIKSLWLTWNFVNIACVNFMSSVSLDPGNLTTSCHKLKLRLMLKSPFFQNLTCVSSVEGSWSKVSLTAVQSPHTLANLSSNCAPIITSNTFHFEQFEFLI